MKYLIDTSAYARANRPTVRAALAAIPGYEIAVAFPLLLEVGWSCPNSAEFDAAMALFDRFTYVEASGWAQRRASQVQGLLAARGAHRAAGLADLITAAMAEQHQLTVLHYDRDFDTIATITGQPTRWIVEPGTADS